MCFKHQYLVPCVLLFCVLSGASAAQEFRPQDVLNNSESAPGSPGACAITTLKEFTVKCKDRYFFGETPAITVSITNTGGKARTVKEAEHQKFSLELNGTFQNNSGQETKKLVYDGSWDIPKEIARVPRPGETQEWLGPKKREPKFVTLLPSESTNLELDLSHVFGSYLGVGKYKLAVKVEGGPTVIKLFEVYFDQERSVAFLSRYLTSDETLEQDCADKKLASVWCELALGKEHSRTWALYRLAEFNKEKLITILEELARSGTEDQRAFASPALIRIKAEPRGPR